MAILLLYIFYLIDDTSYIELMHDSGFKVILLIILSLGPFETFLGK